MVSVHDITNKILSRDSNYIVDVVFWQKFGNSSFSLHEKCPIRKLFVVRFSRIRTEYGEIRIISPYSVRMRESTNQK